MTQTTTANNDKFVSQQNRYTLNRLLLRDVGLRGIGFHLLAKIYVSGQYSVPATGPVIVMINHIAAIDPAVAMGLVHNRFVVPISKIENLDIPALAVLLRLWGAITIRRGEVDRAALQQAIDLLNAGNALILAPEGTRQPALQEAKNGIAYLATKTNAVIVPLGIDGTYGFTDNVKHLKRTPVTATFGRCFRFKAQNAGRIPHADLAQMTHEAMYQLAALLPPHRRGVYSDLSKATETFIEFG